MTRMEEIKKAWENAREIRGHGKNYWQTIDSDQAVDDDGKACYQNYTIVTEEEELRVTADEMEEFAGTR